MSSVRTVLLALPLALLLTAPAVPAQTQAAPKEAPPVTREQALSAWDSFRAAPESGLRDAVVFLRYMQAGAVHTVLDSKVVFWMYQDYPSDVQAVLYAAYMGGNLDSQLRGRKQGDDPVAGMESALDAYARLRKTHPKLVIAQLDQLAEARTGGRLQAAVQALSGTP